MRIFSRGKRLNYGQALPEYIVGMLVVMAALFTPVEVLNNQNAASFITESFQRNYQGYEFAMSQPAED